MAIVLIAIVLIFLQVITAAINFPLILLAFYWDKENRSKLYILAFLTGFLSDMLMGTNFGFTSLFYLIFVGAISLFRTKFAYNWKWAVLFILIAQLVWSYAWRLNF